MEVISPPARAYPETREEICDALRQLAVSDVDEAAPLYQLQYQLSSVLFAKAFPVTTTGCKHKTIIDEHFAAMQMHPDPPQTSYSRIWSLHKLACDDKDSAAYIAQTGLECIYRGMEVSALCAHYGCDLIYHVPKTDGSVIAVLKAIANFRRDSSEGKGICFVAVKFLYEIACNTSLPNNLHTELVNVPDAGSVIVGAKHTLKMYPDYVEMCNAILQSL